LSNQDNQPGAGGKGSASRESPLALLLYRPMDDIAAALAGAWSHHEYMKQLGYCPACQMSQAIERMRTAKNE